MLRTMILIREFEECAIAKRTAGQIYGAVHPYVGQEAVAANYLLQPCGPPIASRVHTEARPLHSEGVHINAMMAELFGRVDGCCKGRGGSMHIADFRVGMLGANGIVGGGLPIAAGAALAAQLCKGEHDVVVCFFGDGAVAEGENF